MMGTAIFVFVMLACTCVQTQGEENCNAQERDMRALVVMIRQLRTEMTDTLTKLHEKVTTQQRESEKTKNQTDQKVETQQREIEEMKNKTYALEKKNEYLTQALHHAVGFSVRGMKEVSYGVMTFSNTITNVDNSYNEATGVFTCKIPGHYYISTSLLKELNYKGPATCFIHKNSESLTQAYTLAGRTAAVANTYVHLSRGDTVKLGGCSETATWDTSPRIFSFGGFLVTPDAA